MWLRSFEHKNIDKLSFNLSRCLFLEVGLQRADFGLDLGAGPMWKKDGATGHEAKNAHQNQTGQEE